MAKALIGILLLCSVFSGYSTPNKVLNKRECIRVTYTSQIGVYEHTGQNDGREVETYLGWVNLKKGNPWCAAFVSWCLSQCQVNNPKSGYCPVWFRKNNLLFVRSVKPSQIIPLSGDVFGIYFPEKKRIAHVGFIHQWGTKYTITVEGNTNEKGSREGDGVYKKRRLTRQIYAVSRFIDL
jgi:hypothetical protein